MKKRIKWGVLQCTWFTDSPAQPVARQAGPRTFHRTAEVITNLLKYMSGWQSLTIEVRTLIPTQVEKS